MKPYGERKKRQPGGREHWIFSRPRSYQERKIKEINKYGWDGDYSYRSQQRNFARNENKRICNEETI